MRTASMSISDFLHREKEPFSAKVERHFKKYGMVYKVAGVTVILLTTGSIASAMVPSPLDVTTTAATGGIDIEARKLYRQLVNIGKWFIVFKGGIDIIKSMGNGDMDGAKKHFFGYLLTYVFLLGLPYGLDKVGDIFDHATTPTTGGQ